MPTRWRLDPFARALVFELLDAEPEEWRLREVHAITPVDSDSYRERVSYHFRIGPDLVAKARIRAEAAEGKLPTATADHLDILLPLDYLPKHLLLDFSIQDAAGCPLTLLPSTEITALTFELASEGLQVFAEDASEEQRVAAKFFESFAPLIFALISTGQGTIARRAEKCGLPGDGCDLLTFVQAGTRFLRAAVRAARQVDVDRHTESHCRRALGQLYDTITEVPRPTRRILAGRAGFHSPLLVPALVLDEYLRHRPAAGGPLHAEIADFLGDSQRFLLRLGEFAQTESQFAPLAALLITYTEQYIAYVPIRAPIGQDFLIKMEHLTPCDPPPWRDRWRRLYQRYPIGLGDSRSIHVEITCEHPLELEQVPSRTRMLDRDGKELPAGSVFKSEFSTRAHQHFYSGALGPEAWDSDTYRPRAIELEIHYAVDLTTRMAYWLVALVSLTALVIFVKEFVPPGVRGAQVAETPLVTTLPLITALIAVLISWRPQESLVALAIGNHKAVILGAALVMVLCLALGFLWPEGVLLLRKTLGLGNG